MILDTNCFAPFFDKKNAKHQEFVPALNWVLKGDGKLMIGGTKYMEELKKASKYISFFNNLRICGKLIHLDDAKVDEEMNAAMKKEDDPDFDDPHLVGMVIIGRCMLLCSEDMRSVRFLQDRKFYPSYINTPSYYTGQRNQNILSRNYIDISNLRKYYNHP